LKHLPVRLASDADCIVTPGAHPALVTIELYNACLRRREQNRENRSAPRAKAGVQGKVWPLAGQLKCGHCGEKAWTSTIPYKKGKREGTDRERTRVCCCERRRDPTACPGSAWLHYEDVLGRVIGIVKERLAAPGALAAMEAELTRQLAEHARTDAVERPKLEKKAKALDQKIATAVANMMHCPDDLRDEAIGHVRGLKEQAAALRQEIRNLDAERKVIAPISPEELKQTIDMVHALSPSWQTEEEAELLRASLRDLIAEVRVYCRKWRPGDPRPKTGKPPKKVLGRLEVDLVPCVAELITMGTHKTHLCYTISADF